MTLIEFIEARIAEDEAGHYPRQPSDHGDFDTPDGGCVACGVEPPQSCRVLRQREAFRLIVERHKDCGLGYGYCDDGGHGIWREEDGGPGCPELFDLASIWSDHPDFREAWRA